MSDIEKSAPNESDQQNLPAHIEEAVQAIASLHAAHEQDASPLQRIVERATSRAGRPAFVALLTGVVVAWVALNFGLIRLGRSPIDEPPFFWLQGAITLTALYMTILILTTQRREDELTGLREQLTLELAILGEQKAAKIIALLEEMRRDDPHMSDRRDPHADALSTPADPNAVLEALKETQGLTSDADGGDHSDSPGRPSSSNIATDKKP
ncbi:MAG: DUF1003 domain-containing protein [Sphingomicrobium sp.]